MTHLVLYQRYVERLLRPARNSRGRRLASYAVENLAQADAPVFGRATHEMMEAARRPFAQTGARPDWMEPSTGRFIPDLTNHNEPFFGHVKGETYENTYH